MAFMQHALRLGALGPVPRMPGLLMNRSLLAAALRGPVPRVLPLRAPLTSVRHLTTSRALRTAVEKAAVPPTPAELAVLTKQHRKIAYWLLGTAGMVFTMVVVGGWTRLTKSGLSMVTWHPAWEKYDPAAEFERYKSSPEYQRVNRHMSVDDFERIYFWEWFHRMWGRAIGLAFAGPLAYFALRGRVPGALWKRLALMGGIGGTQGLVGWWMVKSGLEHERFNEYSVPRVSPYRLATHLGFAFTVYSLLVWTGLDLLRGRYLPGGVAALPGATVAAARKLKGPVAAATAVIALTVASGAFVAGNDAGHAYNDWPLMAGRFIPEQFWDPSLGPRNVFENTATVQFDHRMLAYASIAAVGAMHGAAKKAGGSAVLAAAPGVRTGLRAVGGLVLAQALLGITTLMLYVPTHLAATHQGGALALLTGAIFTLNAVSRAAAAPALEGAAAAAAAPPVQRAGLGLFAAALGLGLSRTAAVDAKEERAGGAAN